MIRQLTFGTAFPVTMICETLQKKFLKVSCMGTTDYSSSRACVTCGAPNDPTKDVIGVNAVRASLQGLKKEIS